VKSFSKSTNGEKTIFQHKSRKGCGDENRSQAYRRAERENSQGELVFS
jgi:hypothetical protein